MTETIFTGTDPHVGSDERWQCECCGVRGKGVERGIYTSVGNGVRVFLYTMFLCSRCHGLKPQVAVCAAHYLLREGRVMPQLEEWLAKATEPKFDMREFVMQNQVRPSPGDEPVLPYKPSKIIVAVR